MIEENIYKKGIIATISTVLGAVAGAVTREATIKLLSMVWVVRGKDC